MAIRAWKSRFKKTAGGAIALAAWDLLRYEALRESYGGPFNDQRARADLFRSLLAALECTVIVETGTYRGTTTAHMQRVSGLPVYSADDDLRSHLFAKVRFWGNPFVQVVKDDSRRFLLRLLPGHDGRFARPFFYLDAHWAEDLPLAEEIRIIFTLCPQAVVMVDDFKVPADPGYRFDDFGPGKVIDLALLAPLQDLGFQVFFPAIGSENESGHRRGCALLVLDPQMVQALSGMPELRPHREGGEA